MDSAAREAFLGEKASIWTFSKMEEGGKRLVQAKKKNYSGSFVLKYFGFLLDNFGWESGDAELLYVTITRNFAKVLQICQRFTLKLESRAFFISLICFF